MPRLGQSVRFRLDGDALVGLRAGARRARLLVVKRETFGPRGDGFVAWCTKQGYSPNTASRYMRLSSSHGTKNLEEFRRSVEPSRARPTPIRRPIPLPHVQRARAAQRAREPREPVTRIRSSRAAPGAPGMPRPPPARLS
jgi:hypothetical protein